MVRGPRLMLGTHFPKIIVKNGMSLKDEDVLTKYALL